MRVALILIACNLRILIAGIAVNAPAERQREDRDNEQHQNSHGHIAVSRRTQL